MTPWIAAHQTSLSFTISWNLLKLISIESVMPSSHFILCHPLLLLPSIFPNIRVFSNELAFPIRRLKYWSFSFSISPSNGYSGLVSLRIDWLDLLVVQRTLKSLLQHHSLKHHSLAPRLSYDSTLTSDSHFIVLHDHMFIGILGLIVIYSSSYLSVLWPPLVSF